MTVQGEVEPSLQRYKTLIARVRMPGEQAFKALDGAWTEPR